MPEVRKATRRGVQVYQTFTPTLKDRAQAQNKKDMKELVDQLKVQNERTQELYEKMTKEIAKAEQLYNNLVALGRKLESVNHSRQHTDKD